MCAIETDSPGTGLAGHAGKRRWQLAPLASNFRSEPFCRGFDGFRKAVRGQRVSFAWASGRETAINTRCIAGSLLFSRTPPIVTNIHAASTLYNDDVYVHVCKYRWRIQDSVLQANNYQWIDDLMKKLIYKTIQRVNECVAIQ